MSSKNDMRLGHVLNLLSWLAITAFFANVAHAQTLTIYNDRPTFTAALPANTIVAIEDFASVATNYTMSTTRDQWNGFSVFRTGTGTFGDSGYCPQLNSPPINPSYCPDYNATSPAVPGMIGSFDAGASITITPTEEIYAFGFNVVDWNDGSHRSFFTVYYSNGTSFEVYDNPFDSNAGFRGLILDTASINAGIHIDRIEWTEFPGASEIVAYWDITTVSKAKDFSDAPTAGYGGAEHDIVTGLTIGASVTAEATDYNDAAAAADADDGVTFPTMVQAENVIIPVLVSGAGGFLQAWVDWNDDDSFGGAGEQIATNVQDGGAGDSDGLANGTIALSTTVPIAAGVGQTYARFRWSTTSGIGSSGFASSGEVEDYAPTIVAGVTSLSISKVGSAPGFVTGNIQLAPAGTVVTYTFTITNTGNQTIDDVSLTDLHGGTGTDPDPDIDTATLTDNGTAGDSTNADTGNGVWDELGPLDVLTITATYTVTQADVDTLQ
ncbi:MAG: GEVED domain-containing protein [Pseudomonadota bacterium]